MIDPALLNLYKLMLNGATVGGHGKLSLDQAVELEIFVPPGMNSDERMKLFGSTKARWHLVLCQDLKGYYNEVISLVDRCQRIIDGSQSSSR